MNKKWTLHVEWENKRISVDIGEIVQLQHCAVKMQRTEDGSKLTGRLSIDGNKEASKKRIHTYQIEENTTREKF